MSEPLLEQTDLSSLLGDMSGDEQDRLRERLLEADRQTTAIDDLLTIRTGLPFHDDAMRLYSYGQRDALLSRDSYWGDCDVNLTVDLTVGPTQAGEWPHWTGGVRLSIKCDQQPPRHDWCLHDVVNEIHHALGPDEAIQKLLDALRRLAAQIHAADSVWLLDHRHGLPDDVPRLVGNAGWWTPKPSL